MTAMSATGPASEGKGARTRAAIQEAAVIAFRRDGYQRATLAGIAEELDITRSAVLHHFSSKAELLRQSVEPFFARLDELLDRVESRAPIPDRQRRLLVTEVVDLVAEYRQVAAFLTSDPSVSSHLGPDLQLPARAQRFVAITVGAQGSELAGGPVARRPGLGPAAADRQRRAGGLQRSRHPPVAGGVRDGRPEDAPADQSRKRTES